MKIGLIGNQNSGKTTLFNILTGMNAKVGNWPGVTIEKKTGIIKGTDYIITDLPGIYSLSPYTLEENISRDFIFKENPDIIINIIDATCLERSLYLTTQLLETDCKVIIALNMADLLETKGIEVDINKLENSLKTKIVKISALKNTGIDELINAIKNVDKKEHISIFDNEIVETKRNIEKLLTETHKDFISTKVIERDINFKDIITCEINEEIKKLESKKNLTLEEIIATERYDFIEKILSKVLIQKPEKNNITQKLDKIFLNKFLAFPIFIIIMFLIYYLSVGVVGSATVDLIGEAIDSLSEFTSNTLTQIGVAEWLNSLIVDGIIAGVGAVIGFIPQLIILFLCIALLETTGYMSRIALMLDKAFRKLGLSGKTIIPLIVGSGCSVPGIMASRIIENEDERKMTVMLTPFIPCSAKLPIIALFSGFFFADNSGFISASLYFFAVCVIILSSLILKKFVFKHTSTTYISELPEYKVPSIKYVIKDVFDKVIAFIKRAGSIILLCSIVIWFLLSFSLKLEYGVEIKDSILAFIGNGLSWIFYPMLGTKSWGATVSAIQGLVAKEQVVSSMAVIAGLSADIEEGSAIFASSGIFGFFTPITAYAFMIFNLFSAPCFGALGAMKKELGGTKKLLKAMAFQTGIAWCLATLFYQIASRINLATFIVFLLIIILIILIIKSIRKNNKKANAQDAHIVIHVTNKTTHIGEIYYLVKINFILF